MCLGSGGVSWRRTNLILCHLHIDDDVIDDLVNGTLYSAAIPGCINEGVDKLKDTVHKVLKSQHFTLKTCESNMPTTNEHRWDQIYI